MSIQCVIEDEAIAVIANLEITFSDVLGVYCGDKRHIILISID